MHTIQKLMREKSSCVARSTLINRTKARDDGDGKDPENLEIVKHQLSVFMKRISPTRLFRQHVGTHYPHN